ncbi:hypothetical protein ABIC44_003297 [Sphingomonas sp. 1185]
MRFQKGVQLVQHDARFDRDRVRLRGECPDPAHVACEIDDDPVVQRLAVGTSIAAACCQGEIGVAQGANQQGHVVAGTRIDDGGRADLIDAVVGRRDLPRADAILGIAGEPRLIQGAKQVGDRRHQAAAAPRNAWRTSIIDRASAAA